MPLEIKTYIKGYHAYKSTWSPTIGEQLVAEHEPNNSHDKFAVAIIKSGKVVGHLKKGKSGWFAESISYFLKYPKSSCSVEITEEKANFGYKQGLQIPCAVKIDGEAKHIECLQRVLREKNEM